MLRSVGKNYAYNLFYQLLQLLTPMITAPYLARVLGPDGVGSISYAESIVSYFTLFAAFGMSTYGQREISYVQDSKKKRSVIFWEIKLLELISSLFVLSVYIPFARWQKEKIMYLIFSLNIISVFASVTWFFQGMEEFKKIVFRNTLIKVMDILYIFLAVKTKSDLNKYVFGIAFFLFISNAPLWFCLPRYLERPNWKALRPFRHVGIIVTLFVPTIAIQVYTVLDKTMIGAITQNAFENGYYEQAIKIVKLALTIVTSLGVVLTPRIGFCFGRGDKENIKSYMYQSYHFVWFIGIPICFGLIGVSPNFVPWFFGAAYVKVIPILQILSFLVVAIGMSSVTGRQFMIPAKMEKQFSLSVSVGALINFFLNTVLIHFFASIGAALASVIAEVVVAVIQIILIRKEIEMKKVVMMSSHYLIAGGVMLLLLNYLNARLTSSALHTFLLILVGVIVYFTSLVLMRDAFFIEKVERIARKFRR